MPSERGSARGMRFTTFTPLTLRHADNGHSSFASYRSSWAVSRCFLVAPSLVYAISYGSSMILSWEMTKKKARVLFDTSKTIFLNTEMSVGNGLPHTIAYVLWPKICKGFLCGFTYCMSPLFTNANVCRLLMRSFSESSRAGRVCFFLFVCRPAEFGCDSYNVCIW